CSCHPTGAPIISGARSFRSCPAASVVRLPGLGTRIRKILGRYIEVMPKHISDMPGLPLATGSSSPTALLSHWWIATDALERVMVFAFACASQPRSCSPLGRRLVLSVIYFSYGTQ